MSARRSWWLTGTLAVALAQPACTDDATVPSFELIPLGGDDGRGGADGRTAGQGGQVEALVPLGGESAEIAGGGASSESGRASSGSGPGHGGSSLGGTTQAGTSGQGGPGGTPDAQAGAAGGASTADDGAEQLTFCPRVTSPSALSFDASRDFDHAVYADCRVKGLSGLYPTSQLRQTFLNDLFSWNLNLWGCQGKPVREFKLVFGRPELTSADVARLIEIYLAEVQGPLELSAGERAELLAALQRLGGSLIVPSESEYSRSTCGAEGSGGNAGAAGASPGGEESSGGTEAAGGGDSGGRAGEAGAAAGPGGAGNGEVEL